MQQAYIKDIFKKLLIIFTLIYSVHCCVPGGTIVKYQKIDHSNESIFTWLVVVNHTKSEYFGLAYGSLIHPKAVLTADIDFTREPTENYFVQKDCHIHVIPEANLTGCTTRTVSKIINQYDPLPSDDSWVLLILKEPFDITPTTAPINLVKDINTVDTEHCLFTRWTRVIDNDTSTRGLMIQTYETKFINGEFSPSDLHPEQLKDDRDWIIGEKFHTRLLNKDIDLIALNFMGSPLSCAIKGDNQSFVQVGIATFSFGISFEKNNPAEQEGSLINVIKSYDEIMIYLNGTV